MFDEITKITLLYDFYGKLLSKRQNEVMYLYHDENLTLSEIADEFKISRQGVHDALKNAEKLLLGYEEKLKLVEKFENKRISINKIDSKIDGILEENKNDKQLVEKLNEVKSIIDKIND